MSEALVTRARGGDETAFAALVEPHRRALHLHCYRLLGSMTDAEDVVQESLLAAWRGLPGFEGRASVRSWLYAIATNRSLNAARERRRRPPTSPAPPFDAPAPSRRDEVTWLQPYPDTLLGQLIDDRTDSHDAADPSVRYQLRETVELAFVAGLQRLPPRQAAVLILRDVLAYSTDETAELLRTSPAAVKAALQRARAAMARHRPTREDAAPTTSRAAPADVVRRFADAFTARDLDGLLALLTEDAWLAMPPAPHVYQGAAAIAGFLRTSTTWRPDHRVVLVPTGANTQPAFACYLAGPGDETAWAAGLIVLTERAGRISAITRFLGPEVFDAFGLPPTPSEQ